MNETDHENEYLAAITEILTIFDDDPQMTEDIMAAAAAGQDTAESAALVRIREIGRTVMEGRWPAASAWEAGSLPVSGDGQFMFIAFMGRIEYTGYVTEITKNGQPAYRIDLPEKIWGGNPLAWVEHAASAWFSDRPVTEDSVRKAWEAQVRRAAERARQEAEWRRMQEQRAITADAARDLEHEFEEDEDPEGYHEDGGGF